MLQCCDLDSFCLDVFAGNAPAHLACPLCSVLPPQKMVCTIVNVFITLRYMIAKRRTASYALILCDWPACCHAAIFSLIRRTLLAGSRLYRRLFKPQCGSARLNSSCRFVCC